MWLVFDVCKNQFKVDGRDGEMELGLWQVEGGEGGGTFVKALEVEKEY